MNECDLGKDNCSDFAMCSNTIGSYECTCSSGYVGDGRVCTGML